jgi:hypothetical protein
MNTQSLPAAIIPAYDGRSADFSDGYLITDPRWHIYDGGKFHASLSLSSPVP